ncbi:MAG: cytochrome c [Marinoscillum sp.]|jgi:cytochrome c
MKSIYCISIIALVFSSCSGGGKSEAELIKEQTTMAAPADPFANWESNNGIGPIKSLDLPSKIDTVLVNVGRKSFEAKCTACHKIEKKFIGPSPKGILTRRTAAWVMNMILNPNEMILKDPMARQLLIEANGAPMANQSLPEEEARAVLEYFRTL